MALAAAGATLTGVVRWTVAIVEGPAPSWGSRRFPAGVGDAIDPAVLGLDHDPTGWTLPLRERPAAVNITTPGPAGLLVGHPVHTFGQPGTSLKPNRAAGPR
jgi:hypothetical protein